MKILRHSLVKALTLITALALVLGAVALSDAGLKKASAASWNGTNYGGGSRAGYRTFLDAFGIDYDTYIKWLDDHDDDSPNPDYYLGTPYVGYDHRNPHGDCQVARGTYDTPGVEGLNCTGFVWHVLYKAAVNSGASRSQINSLPVMGQVTPTWANLGVYRIYFKTKQEALDSGVLEKGDLLWIYGTKDNHNAIFYGDDPHEDLFWHSAGRDNNLATIRSAGTFLGMWVAKVTMPDDIELHVSLKSRYSSADNGKFGAKYCVFDNYSDAWTAAHSSYGSDIWDERIGTVCTDSSGYGCLRQESAPSNSSLWTNGKPNKSLSYFRSSARRVSAKYDYYAVEWQSPQGESRNTEVFEFRDSGQRTSSGCRLFQFKPIKMLSTPRLDALTSSPEGVKLSWSAVPGAEYYRVYYKNSKGGWTQFGQTSSNVYLDKDVNVGATYTYTIRCVDNDGDYTSSYIDAGWKHTYTGISTPRITALESTPEGIDISWNAVDGAAKYRLYYMNSQGGWSTLGETAATSYTDLVVNPGKTYFYTIRCLNKSGRLNSDYVHAGWKHTYSGVPTPQFTALESTPDGVKLSWDAVEGAAKYRLYYKNSKGGWSVLTETTGTSFTDEIVNPGKTYIYTIRCLNKAERLNSDYLHDGQSLTYTGVPTPTFTALESTPDGVKLSWDAVEGAEKYRLYYKNSKGGWSVLGETAAVSYTDEIVSAGNTYTYNVCCLNKAGRIISETPTGQSYTYTGIAIPQISSLESTKNGVRLSWKAVEGASRYRLFYKNSQGGWSVLGETAATSFTDDVVNPGKAYLYTIRCLGPRGYYNSLYNTEGFRILYQP